jgi:hypothetical protein
MNDMNTQFGGQGRKLWQSTEVSVFQKDMLSKPTVMIMKMGIMYSV